jgi:hypothetical protein
MWQGAINVIQGISDKKFTVKSVCICMTLEPIQCGLNNQLGGSTKFMFYSFNILYIKLQMILVKKKIFSDVYT